jgi:hypothetical protein
MSGGGNNGGYSCVIALVKDGTIQKGNVLAGGGGAALASDITNLLISSTCMEALGLVLAWSRTTTAPKRAVPGCSGSGSGVVRGWFPGCSGVVPRVNQSPSK